LRRSYEIEICWSAFPLHPHTPEEGLALEELFAGRSVDINQMMARLKQVAEGEGLPLGERKKTYNSRLAQELGKWAESKGKGDEFHNAVFRAYFVDGKNIGKIPELVDLAKSVGLPGKEAQKVLETRAFKEAVDLDWSRAYAMGVTAVPTFVINNRTAVGAQPYEALEQLMKVNDVKKRDPNS
jgi:predicted DsbA family dithiol-disulfide isomerase